MDWWMSEIVFSTNWDFPSLRGSVPVRIIITFPHSRAKNQRSRGSYARPECGKTLRTGTRKSEFQMGFEPHDPP